MKIGEAIKLTRKEKGFKQNYIADGIALSPSTISKIEHGNDTSFKTFEKIAAKLDISVGELMFRAMEETDVPEDKRPVFRYFKRLFFK